MWVRGMMTALVAAVAMVVLVAPAGANSTRAIAQDLKDGKLDASYTRGELEAYFKDAVVQGYGNPITQPVTPVDAGVAAEESPTAGEQPATDLAGEETTSGAGGSPELGTVAEVGSLPFTGVDLALLTVGGLLLLGLGLGARRLGGQRT